MSEQTNQQTAKQSATGGSAGGTSGRSSAGRSGGKGESLAVWTFDSVGPRKYAVQIRKASNGNPCLKIVEGVPDQNGEGYRKFHLTIWSEDFEQFWETLDKARAYMAEHDIKTPEGHKYDPNKPRRRNGSRRRQT